MRSGLYGTDAPRPSTTSVVQRSGSAVRCARIRSVPVVVVIQVVEQLRELCEARRAPPGRQIPAGDGVESVDANHVEGLGIEAAEAVVAGGDVAEQGHARWTAPLVVVEAFASDPIQLVVQEAQRPAVERLVEIGRNAPPLDGADAGAADDEEVRAAAAEEPELDDDAADDPRVDRHVGDATVAVQRQAHRLAEMVLVLGPAEEHAGAAAARAHEAL